MEKQTRTAQQVTFEAAYARMLNKPSARTAKRVVNALLKAVASAPVRARLMTRKERGQLHRIMHRLAVRTMPIGR